MRAALPQGATIDEIMLVKSLVHCKYVMLLRHVMAPVITQNSHNYLLQVPLSSLLVASD